MRIDELEKNKKYWCWSMHRILIYKGTGMQITGLPKMYRFIDFGDCEILMTSDQVEQLEVYKA